jgi:hypothetical protein
LRTDRNAPAPLTILRKPAAAKRSGDAARVYSYRLSMID